MPDSNPFRMVAPISGSFTIDRSKTYVLPPGAEIEVIGPVVRHPAKTYTASMRLGPKEAAELRLTLGPWSRGSARAGSWIGEEVPDELARREDEELKRRCRERLSAVVARSDHASRELLADPDEEAHAPTS